MREKKKKKRRKKKIKKKKNGEKKDARARRNGLSIRERTKETAARCTRLTWDNE